MTTGNQDQHEKIRDAARLWGGYVLAKQSLLRAGFIRSHRGTEADFAEWLVAFVLGGKLPANMSTPAFDIEVGNKRIQVKSIAKSEGNTNGYIIREKDRNNDPHTGATHFAFVVFDGLMPAAIFILDERVVRTFPKKQIRRKDLEQMECKLDFDLSEFRQEYSQDGM